MSPTPESFIADVRSAKSDPITRGVIRKMLPAIADEMSYVLQRSSYNMMIYEVRDYCCALVDIDGALIAQNLGGVSHFVADLGVIIKDAVARFGLDSFRPGDGFITNHQAVAGQHLNNVVTYRPVFVEGELLCFALVRAHWVDVGGLSTGFGASGAGANDPWVEGLQLDQVKLYEQGVLDEKVLSIIRTNIRFPESSLGDMRAQFASCSLAEVRLGEVVGKYGRQTYQSAVADLFADSEARCRRVVAQIPDGEYYAESFLDGDAADEGRPLEVKVRVVIAGSDMTIDLTRCSLQRRGSVNGRTLAGAYIAYKALTTPDEPVNEGSFRGLKVEIQEGNFMMAAYPAPMAAWSLALPTVVDTVFAALAEPLKAWVPAAHFGTLGGVVVFSGTDPATGARFVTQSLEAGGWGAKPVEDGQSASVSVCQGDVRNAPIEAMELKWPVRFVRRELRQDSGGAGRYRGGLGLATEVTNLVEGTWRLGPNMRKACPPWGISGGMPGATGVDLFAPAESGEFGPPSSGRQWAPAGSAALILTAGGGGWGEPFERPVDEVVRDVVEGFVSVAAAREQYGVALDATTLALDLATTESLRATAAVKTS